MIQSYGFQGAVTNIAAAGTFFLYVESTTAGLGIDDQIILFIDGANMGTRRPGDWVQLPRQASRWQIQPVDPAARGVVSIGVGKVGTSRVVGQVEVIDGGVQRSLQGKEFLASFGIGGLAANHQFLSFSNQRAERVAIRRLRIATTGAGRWQLRALPVSQSIPGAPQGQNIAASKAAAFSAIANVWSYVWNETSEVPTQVNATAIAILYTNLVANDPKDDILFTSPLIVPPGEGLVWSSSTQNQSAWVTFEGSVL